MKNKAIAHARKNVSEIYPFGNGYKFSTYDKKANAWRERHPSDYWSARNARSQALIDAATDYINEINGTDDFSPQYDGGKWTDYVNA